MKLKVLTNRQIEQFIEEGYVLLPQAFSRDIADEVRAFLWEKLELNPDDPTTWTKPLVHIREVYTHGPFAAAWTLRVAAALDDVMGEGRWRPHPHLGWWPVSFPGFTAPPWQPPQTGWHVDGIQFHHHVNSPDQGLLPLFIFSDIGPGDGGTAICPGSHRTAARVLAEAEPDGLDLATLCKRVLEYPRENVVELNGQAGDVVLLHPFMLHARSANTGQRVRFICNPCISLHEPMNLDRPDGEYSPVEQAIVNALTD